LNNDISVDAPPKNTEIKLKNLIHGSTMVSVFNIDQPKTKLLYSCVLMRLVV